MNSLNFVTKSYVVTFCYRIHFLHFQWHSLVCLSLFVSSPIRNAMRKYKRTLWVKASINVKIFFLVKSQIIEFGKILFSEKKILMLLFSFIFYSLFWWKTRRSQVCSYKPVLTYLECLTFHVIIQLDKFIISRIFNLFVI